MSTPTLEEYDKAINRVEELNRLVEAEDAALEAATVTLLKCLQLAQDRNREKRKLQALMVSYRAKDHRAATVPAVKVKYNILASEKDFMPPTKFIIKRALQEKAVI